MLKFYLPLCSVLIQIFIKKEVYIKNVKIIYKIILTSVQVGWNLKPDLYIGAIPKQLNFKIDPTINKTRNLEQKCKKLI